MKFKIGDIIYLKTGRRVRPDFNFPVLKIVGVYGNGYKCMSIDKKDTPINYWFTIRYIDKYYMNKKDARKMKLKKLYEKI